MDDFSTNRHSLGIKFEACRHPDISFIDGNIVLMAGDFYFTVHQGVLCRHSERLAESIKKLKVENSQPRLIDGHPVLVLHDQPKDLARFLLALYDGVSGFKHDVKDFGTISSLLRMSTKYGVEHIRRDLLRGMSIVWPRTLGSWELREAEATDSSGHYKPRTLYPHPILVINLARDINAPELLPSAFYDLSRASPSEIATGYIPAELIDGFEVQILSDDDLLSTLKGREQTSRFFSTFVVNELEYRDRSASCLHRNEQDPLRRRICIATFERITFEILRDANGVVYHRTSDPLFAIMDAELMQNRNELENSRLDLHRACEPCRVEFAATVDNAREELWSKLPVWFNVELPLWP